MAATVSLAPSSHLQGVAASKASAWPQAWVHATLAFWVSRAVVALGIWLSGLPGWVHFVQGLYQLLFSPPELAGRVFAIHPFFYESGRQALWDIVQYWDGYWYLDLAQNGYQYDGTTMHQSVAHYPGFSFLSRVLGEWVVMPLDLGLTPTEAIVWAGTVASNLLFWVALAALYVLIRRHHEPRVATLSVWLLALCPASLFCSMFLSESLFLACIVVGFLALEGKRTGWAALLSWPASLTRFNGVGILIGALQTLGYRRWTAFQWGCIGLMLLSVLAFPLYLGWRFGEPGLYFRLHSHYRGHAQGLVLVGWMAWFFAMVVIGWRFQTLKAWAWDPLPPLRRRLMLGAMAIIVLLGNWMLLDWGHYFNGPGYVGLWLAVTGVGLTIGLLPPVYRTYTVLSLGSLMTGGNYMSMHRYLLAVFPVFWSWGLLLAQAHVLSRWLLPCVLVLLSLMTLAYTSLYAAKGWLFLF
jgi:hypothetical protein